MKGKLVLASALCAIASLVQASAVESANIFGVMCISDSGDTDTIIGIPWVDVGSTGNANTIHVTNIVCGTGLTTGDLIYWWDNDTKEGRAPGYRVWEWTSGGYWNPKSVIIVGESENTEEPGVDNKTLARGNAIILHRQSPKTEDTPKPIYIYGQYYTGSTAASCSIAAAGAFNSPVYTLIASPSTTNVDINVVFSGTPNTNDRLIVDGAKTLLYNTTDHKWGQRTQDANGRYTGWSYTNATIPAGRGIWYKSRGTAASTPTFTW